tara:strand:+ start:3739 stop:4221 length:483 start_codon:yes stop_codon:yes gene_type:complete
MINDLFALGMKRYLPSFKDWTGRKVNINIGAGKQLIPSTVNLDLPDYNANYDPIPYDDNSVDVIHCYHVLEHVDNPIFFLKECQRVLVIGGLMNICVPHHRSDLAWQDITHVRGFTTDTFKTLFENTGYNTGEWRLKEIGTIAIGLVDRNISILTQLEKF